jgi:hypothetical protein
MEQHTLRAEKKVLQALLSLYVMLHEYSFNKNTAFQSKLFKHAAKHTANNVQF